MADRAKEARIRETESAAATEVNTGATPRSGEY